MKYIAIFLFAISLEASASLNGAPRLVARQVQKKLMLVQNAFARQNQNFSLLRGESNEAWYLKRIRLQYAPFVEFDITVFKLKVTPIIEFRWTRNNPKGWTNYRPASKMFFKRRSLMAM